MNTIPHLPTAAQAGHLDCVKKLIDAGADVNIDGSQGCTPFEAAIEEDEVECVKETIQAGADLNIPDKGETPLMLTGRFRSKRCFHELVKAGAEVNMGFLAKIARQLLREENTAAKIARQLLREENTAGR